MASEYILLRRQNQTRCLMIIGALILIVGLICLFVGIALIVQSKTSEECDSKKTTTDLEQCEYSEEAKRVGLDRFLQKAQDRYFELIPNKIADKPGVKPAEIREKYRSYDPTPANIKRVTDEAAKLVKELEAMGINMDKVTLREKRAVAQIAHWAKHGFPYMVPYLYNYYVADWMMGGDIFCWNPMCFVLFDMKKSLVHFEPSTVAELETLGNKFKEVKNSFDQFVSNMKLGVDAGMIRSVTECKAGLDAFKANFRDVENKGPTGIYETSFIKPFLAASFISEMKDDQQREWRGKHGKSATESLREYVLEFIGKPIKSMLRYVEEEHIKHCVPDDVATGFGDLPLKYIYDNGTRTSRETTQKLPSGEKLNGLESYLKILQHFTTNSQTPDEIYRLGEDMLRKLYNEVLELAEKTTKESDPVVAKQQFLKLINSSSQFYNEGDIPANESDANAHKLCSDMKGAEMYCPNRTKAMKNWFAHTKEILSTLDYETAELFHFTGPYQSTPGCPITLKPDFNPASGVPFYSQSDAKCSRVASYNVPFFLARPGPKYESVSLAAHEARPGHHTQVQGYTEHFLDPCSGPIGWIASSTIYLAFSEGWALYAENPLIPEHTKMYEVDPLSKYGMLKWQVWRALRLMMDTGLHSKGKTRDWALNLFEEYAWDTSDVAVKEVTRYQSLPGQAVTYMLGQLAIMRLKDEVNSTLKKKFDIKDFHYQVLRQGPSPLSYLDNTIKKYIACVLDRKGAGCDEVMEPPPRRSPGSKTLNAFVDTGISPWVV